MAPFHTVLPFPLSDTFPRLSRPRRLQELLLSWFPTPLRSTIWNVDIRNIVLELPPAPAALVLVGLAFATLSALSAAAFLLIAVFGPPGGDRFRPLLTPAEAGGEIGEDGRGEDWGFELSATKAPFYNSTSAGKSQWETQLQPALNIARQLGTRNAEKSS